MARKLIRDTANKRTFMKMNVFSNIITGTRTCAQCKRSPKTLYYYWFEPDIGGIDGPPRYSLPFCSIDCYRSYYDVGDVLRTLKLNVMGK